MAIFYDLSMKGWFNNIVAIEDASFTLMGEINYQWLGFDALCTPDRTLVVSSPGRRTPDKG